MKYKCTHDSFPLADPNAVYTPPSPEPPLMVPDCSSQIDKDLRQIALWSIWHHKFLLFIYEVL